MVSLLKSFSKRLADSNAGYGSALFVGVIVLLVVLFLNGFDLQALYVSETAVQLLLVTGIFMRFLSGFGIMLTYASLCAFVFRQSSEQVKGDRKRLTILKIVLALPILAILAYAVYKFVNAFVYSQPLSLVETLIAVYGVWSLLLLVYGIPVVRGNYDPNARKGVLERMGKRVDEMKHSFWRGYQSYLWRDYGKVYSVEFERYRRRMVEIRTILSAFLLLPIALVLMLVPPLGLLSIVLWVRVFSLDYKPFSRGERALLILLVSVVLLVTTYLFLAIDLASLQVYFDVSYATGVFLSIALLGLVIWQS